MAQEAVNECLRVLKESNKRNFDSYSVRNSVLIISHITFGIVACTFLLTTFLKIAVSKLGKYLRMLRKMVLMDFTYDITNMSKVQGKKFAIYNTDTLPRFFQ